MQYGLVLISCTFALLLGEVANACPTGYKSVCSTIRRTDDRDCRCVKNPRSESESPRFVEDNQSNGTVENVVPEPAAKGTLFHCTAEGQTGPLFRPHYETYSGTGELEIQASKAALKKCWRDGASSCEIIGECFVW